MKTKLHIVTLLLLTILILTPSTFAQDSPDLPDEIRVRTLSGYRESILSVAFSPDGSTLVTTSEQKTVRLWNVNEESLILSIEDFPNWVTHVAYSPDGNTIVTVNRVTIDLWDAKTGGNIRSIPSGHTTWINSAKFSPDGSIIATGSDDRTVRLWNANDGTLIRILEGHTLWIVGIAFSPDGNTIASASSDNTIRLWNVNDGTLVRILEGHTDGVDDVAFSPDGSIIASAGIDRTVRLWDVNSGTLMRTLRGHTNRIRSLAYSPDGRIIASAGRDNTIRLWNANDGTLAGVLEGHTAWINAVAFSPDGSILASGSSDFTVRLWELAPTVSVMPQDLQSDAFDGPELQSFWHVQNGGQGSYTLMDGKLVVEGAFNQNIFREDTSTRFYQVTDQEEFSVETSLIFDHRDICSVAGLIIKSPSQNEWVLLKLWGHGTNHAWVRNPNTLYLQFQHRGREIVQFVPGYNPPAGNVPVSLRLDRAGDNYKAWYKPDVQGEWVHIGDTTVALQGPVEVGVFTGICQDEAPGHFMASFDYLRVTPGVTAADPTVSILSPTPGQVFNDGSPLITGEFTGAAPINITLYINDTDVMPFGDMQITENNQFNFTLHEPLAEGEHLASVEITDANGKTASASVLFAVKISIPTVDDEDVYIYWADFLSGKIQRANLDGSNVEDVIAGLERPVGIALDNTNGKIYWNDTNGVSTIKRANLDGSDIERLVTSDQSLKESMVLDTSAGKIYWIHARNQRGGQPTIQCSNLDGSNIATLVTGLQNPRGLALDTSSGKMYWTDVNKIQRSNLDGTSIEDLATVPGFLAYMALDLENQQIYFANHWQINSQTGQGIPQTGKIQRANLDGSNVVDLVDGLVLPAGVSLDLKNGKVYWTNINLTGLPGSIQRANLDGSNVEDLVSGLQGPVGIAISTAPDLIVPLVDAIVSFSPSPLESQSVGELLTLNLNISGGENITGYQATVQYDETALRFVSSENGNYLMADTYTAPPIIAGNTVTVAATSLTGDTNGDGTLATLTFEVIEQKTSSLILTKVLLSDSEGMLSIPHVEDGQVIRSLYLREDVNRDGSVDIVDLMLVAADFTKMGDYITDVNGDGSVNISDIVLVAGAFGNSASASTLLSRATGQVPTKADVGIWLEQAKQLRITDPQSLRGVQFLKQLLLALSLPQETVLHANYPNPFNPETWIPYQLAKSADVTISIYSPNGILVRKLELGSQVAGMYLDRNRAAYWDGKNAAGELVASGVYFYTLTAGDFAATRKMLILK